MNRTSHNRLVIVVVLTLAVVAVSSAMVCAQTAAPNLDVVGIKLGTSVKAAVAIMKANNPRLMVQEQTLQLEGFDQLVSTAIEGSVSGEAGKDTEHFQLGVTMPPSSQVVWGINRTYTYATKNMPSLDMTIAALRKKYGPENIPPDPDPRAGTKFMVWVFDAQGRPLAAGPAHTLYLTCSTPLANAFGSTTILNELHGVRMPAECDAVVLVTASLQSSANVIPGSVVVGNLIVQVANGPAYRASMEATRRVVMAAVKARENKQKQEVDKRGEPKV